MNMTSTIVRRVVMINENRSVFDAAKLMTKEFIGSVVVTYATGIQGLLTEREVTINMIGKSRDSERSKLGMR